MTLEEAESSAVELLTPRERAVQELLRSGLTDAQIAQRLGVTTPAISRHVSEIIGKLGVRNRYEAAAWPERPPWWASSLAPAALFWRKAGAALPFRLSTAAAVLSGGLFVAALAGIGLVVFLLLRDDGGGRVVSGPITVSRSALESYAFSTELNSSSSDGTLKIHLDGVTERFDLQGSYVAQGDLLGRLDMPPRADIWVREPNEPWQSVDVAEGNGPNERWVQLVSVGTLSSQFYLSFHFENLELQRQGPLETIRGIQSQRVRLDKAEMLQLVPRVSSLLTRDGVNAELSGEDLRDLQEDGREKLPDDFAVDAWIAEEGRYPIRLVFTFTVGDDDTLILDLPPGSSVRLQTDITDPDVDVQIEPPMSP